MSADENKISIDKKEMRLFIDDQLYPAVSDSPTAYDFEKEFEKTAKNRSPTLVLILLGVIAFVSIGGYGFSKYLDNKNKNISVAIDAFDDLNLMKLLDRVKRTETERKNTETERKNSESTYNSELQHLQNQRDSSLFTLNALKLGAKETAARKEAIRAQYTEQANALTATYEKNTTQLDAKIVQLNKELADMDSTNVQRAQEQQAAIDSQRLLFDLEKQQLVSEYDTQIATLTERIRILQDESLSMQKNAIAIVSAQYQNIIDGLDPVIKDKRGNQVLERLKSEASKEPALFLQFENLNLPENEMLLLASIQQAIDDLRYISNFVISVPQKNTVPEYTKAMRDLGFIISRNAENLLANSVLQLGEIENQLRQEQSLTAKLQKTVASLQSDVSNLKSHVKILIAQENEVNQYLATVLGDSGDAGMILNVENKNKIPVFISPLYEGSADNANAYIVNRTGDLIGTVTLKKENGYFFAEPAEDTNVASFKANDRILLRLINR